MHKIVTYALFVVALIFGAFYAPVNTSAQEPCGPANAVVALPETVSSVDLRANPRADALPVLSSGGPAYQLISGQPWHTEDTDDPEWVMACLPDDPAGKGYAPKSMFQPIEQEQPAEPVAEADVFVLPTDLRELANGIGSIGYVEPDQVSTDGDAACFERTNMNEPCSTLEGQPVEGVFALGDTMRPGLRLVNGDVMELRSGNANGELIVERVPTEIGGTNGDMYVMFSDEGVAETNVYMDAGHGSFRGDFFLPFPQQEWDMDDVVDITGNQMRMLLSNSDPAVQAWLENDNELPYPQIINPANCSKVEALETGEVTYCDAYNLYVLEWDGTNWIEHFRGVVGVLRDDDNNVVTVAMMAVTDEMIADVEAAAS